MQPINQVNLLFEKLNLTPKNKIFCKTWVPESKDFEIRTYKNLQQDIGSTLVHIAGKRKIFLLSHQGYFSAVCTLATWLNGGCLIPLSPDSPHEKIIYLLKNLQPEGILLEKTDPHLEEKIKNEKITAQILSPEIIFTPSPAKDFTITPPLRELSRTAYILSTSGTTGFPKIIETTDKELSAYINEISSLLPTSSLTHLIQTFPIGFDPSMGDLIWTLLKGACLVPLKPLDIRYLADILDQIDEAWWASTPSFADWSLNFISAPKLQEKITHSFFLGEILKKSFCLRWKKVFNKTEILNLYGPTEATISISYCHLESNLENLPDIAPIGKIHANQKFSIDPQTKELYLAGQQVIKNYFQNKNPESFFESDNTLWYKTGDVVTQNQNTLTITGRIDDQIKIHGQRFNPLDMEIFLQKHQVNLVLIPVKTANQESVSHLIAFTTDKNLTLEQVHGLLKNHYPLIFFPKALHCLEKFPLSASGKVDRRQLQSFKNKI